MCETTFVMPGMQHTGSNGHELPQRLPWMCAPSERITWMTGGRAYESAKDYAERSETVAVVASVSGRAIEGAKG